MKRAMRLQRAGWIGLAVLAIQSGCTHNYYYGATPGCPPYGQTVTTQVGQVCEVPGGTIVTSNAAPATISQATVAGQPVAGSTPPRVVISEPAYSSTFSHPFRWKRPAQDSLAVTRSEGALDETSGPK